MRNQENIHQDYTTYSAGYQLSLTMDIQVYIPPHDPVRLLNQLLEGLDDKKLLSTYSDKGRNSVVPPVIMFKILINICKIIFLICCLLHLPVMVINS